MREEQERQHGLKRQSGPVAERWIKPIEGDERDFLLLLVFVYLQHEMLDRAQAIIEAMLEAGDGSREAVLAQAVIAFCKKNYEKTLEVLARLDRVDPIERYGRRTLTDRQRMRTYLRARSLYELGGDMQATVDLYIRHRDFEGGEEERAERR
ncbi:hypothetical protein [Rhizobium alvei]|uniref:Uncharacterized protein n=1 Tax=Rhizobium alvei TaxID=1132659 RepID=A0ABT8YSX1_9HYPH|nr:hypothetical protein [Rhizobium alvei]MDO6966442.1 hypothetical protein [Rhizobium alvei]